MPCINGNIESVDGPMD